MFGNSHQLQIFEAIISLILVYVVNDFAELYCATKMLAHYKHMLSNKTSGICVRMFRALDENIARSRSNIPTIVPINVSLSPKLMSANKRSREASAEMPSNYGTTTTGTELSLQRLSCAFVLTLGRAKPHVRAFISTFKNEAALSARVGVCHE